MPGLSEKRAKQTDVWTPQPSTPKATTPLLCERTRVAEMAVGQEAGKSKLSEWL